MPAVDSPIKQTNKFGFFAMKSKKAKNKKQKKKNSFFRFLGESAHGFILALAEFQSTIPYSILDMRWGQLLYRNIRKASCPLPLVLPSVSMQTVVYRMVKTEVIPIII